MLRILIRAILISLLITLVIVGCSRNPVEPGTTPDGQPELSSGASDQPSGNLRNLLGYYEFTVYPDTGKVEFSRTRQADLHLNVTGILNSTMGVSAAIVASECDPANGLFVLDVTLTHPFASKPQFSGFDVKGILITPGTSVSGPLVYADTDETRLLNADGYTRWWNPVEFTQPGILGYTPGNLAIGPTGLLTATVNPYKLFADILGPEDPLGAALNEPFDADEGRAVFRAGNSNTRRYRIRFPMDPGPQIRFGYAIDASWAPPDPNPPGEVPDDFPMEANQPEACRIEFVPTASSLYYDSESGAGGGVVKFQIEVYDWQGQYAGDIPNEISTVRIYAPDLMPAGADGVFLDETATMARYIADLAGLTTPTEPGETLIACRIGSADGSTYKQTNAPAPDGSVSAHQVITVDVVDPECEADANNDFGDYIQIDLATPVTGQLCAPTDFKDFYRFEFNPGSEIRGNLVLHCDAEPSRMELYDVNEVKIAEENVSGGSAIIDMDALGLMPGQYYIRVVTQTSGEAFLYMLDLDGEVFNLIPNPVSVTPEFLYFEPVWVTSDENYAYFTGPYAFWVFDLTMDVDSLPLSRATVRSNERSAVCYPYACFVERDYTGPDMVHLLDVTDPTAPVMYEDVYSFDTDIGAVAIDSNYIYVATWDGVDSKLVILDHTADPSSPTIVSDSHVFTDRIREFDLMELGGSQKFVIGGFNNWMDIVDITDPSAPAFHTGAGWGSGEIRDISIQDGFVYVAYSNTSNDEVIQIFEITSGGGSVRGFTPLTRDVHYIDARGDYAYLTDDDNTVTVVNITNPDIPVEGWQGSVPYGSGYIDVNGTRVFIVHPHGGLGIYAAAEDSEWMGYNGEILGVNQPLAYAIDGDYLYAAQFINQYNRSVITLDISDLENVELIGYLQFYGQPNRVLMADGKMIVSNYTTPDTFWTVNTSDPANLSLQIETPVPNYIRGMSMTDTHLYVADGANNMLIYDFSAWPNVTLKNTIPVPAPLYYQLINGGAMYVGSDNNLYTYSLANPESPVLSDTYTAPDVFDDFEIQDEYLYASTWSGMEILDISNPLSPVSVSSTPASTSEFVADIAVDGQLAWLGTSYDNSYIFTIWPPDNPVEIGKFYETDWVSSTFDIIILGDYYIDFRWPFGIEIMDMYP